MNDAIEKLFVLSGVEENQLEKPETGTLLSSSSQLVRENGRNQSTQDLEQRANFHPGNRESLADSSHYGRCPEFQTTPGPFLKSRKNGCQYKVKNRNMQYPDAMPSTSPFSESDSTETIDSPLQTTSSLNNLSSSGLPDFPDDVSQQFTLLQGQPSSSNNLQQLLLQGDTKHKEMLHNGDSKTPNDQITQSSFEIVRPPETTHPENHKLKRNVDWQSEGLNPNITSMDNCWTNIPLPNEGFKHTENEPSKMKINSGNVDTTATDISNSREESPERENHLQRELSLLNKVECKTKTSRQNVSSATAVHASCKPQLQSPVNSAYQLPNCGSFARESFIQPPAIRRQFQPFLPSQRHGHIIPTQQRAGFVPVIQSPWQQRPPRHLCAELIPQECNTSQSDLGSLSYLPPFVFAGG